MYQYCSNINFFHVLSRRRSNIFSKRRIYKKERSREGKKKRRRDSTKSEKKKRRWTDANPLWCTLIAWSERKINRGYFRAACSCTFLFYTFVEIVSLAFRGARIHHRFAHTRDERERVAPFSAWSHAARRNSKSKFIWTKCCLQTETQIMWKGYQVVYDVNINHT